MTLSKFTGPIGASMAVFGLTADQVRENFSIDQLRRMAAEVRKEESADRARKMMIVDAVTAATAATVPKRTARAGQKSAADPGYFDLRKETARAREKLREDELSNASLRLRGAA